MLSLKNETRDLRSENYQSRATNCRVSHTLTGRQARMASLMHRGVDMVYILTVDASRECCARKMHESNFPFSELKRRAEPQLLELNARNSALFTLLRHVDMHRLPGRSLLARRFFSTSLPRREAVPLAFQRHDPPDGSSTGPPILLMHGLFGSQRNNRTMSKYANIKHVHLRPSL